MTTFDGPLDPRRMTRPARTTSGAGEGRDLVPNVDRRVAPAHLRREFDGVVEEWSKAFAIPRERAVVAVRSGVGLALRCGRPFDFATWLRENGLVEQ